MILVTELSASIELLLRRTLVLQCLPLLWYAASGTSIINYTKAAQNVNKSLKLVWLQFAIGLSLPSQNRNKVFRRVGQGVKTPPFHGGITGSNPVRGTKVPPKRWDFFFYHPFVHIKTPPCSNF